MKLIWQLLEWPWLLLLNAWNHFWNFGLYLQEIWRYYRCWPLAKADLLWMLAYGFKSPFEISRSATQQAALPEDLTVYGETPWPTLERVCEAVGLQAGHKFVELGCGTGRNLLFLHYRYGCQLEAYELVPRFVEKFQRLQRRLGLQGIQVHAQNWLEAPLDAQSGDVFYLVGTCYDDQHLDLATERLASLPAGTWVVTTSYALQGAVFEQLKQFEAPFSWGKGTVYVQRLR